MTASAEFSQRREYCGNVLSQIFASRGTQMRFAPGTVIEAQGDPVASVYRVTRGCVRTCMYSVDGDRKVLQFLGAGDFLGLSGNEEWLEAQEAVDTVVLEAIPIEVFERAVASAPDGQRAIRSYLARRVGRYAALLVLTANTSALDRVRTFLQAFAGRRGTSDFVSLPMGRQDIADHLGLSMETVSRSITTLRVSGEIAMKGSAFFRFNAGSGAGTEGALPRAA